MISVERTTRNRHFLRGSNGAIGSTTTRTRTKQNKVMSLSKETVLKVTVSINLCF